MKKGSALLIVLGMLAFLVISAVAFSAYMRYSRLPSSFLRRTSSSRLLAKAALAEAIDHLDIALGNDPFPFSMKNDADSPGEFTSGSDYVGDGYDMPRATTENQSAQRKKRNYWRSHCFIGTNRLVGADETVSTLTLEGLAYLPPALINEARFYSRHSDSARWHNFSFDSGRYAFFAVDVSDHIDINRVFADCPRTSADDEKVTLAYAFENAGHTGAGSPGPDAWDDFISTFNEAVDALPGLKGQQASATANSKLPLISLADLNLAMNAEGWRDTMSPFCRYLKGGKFVADTGTDGARLSSMAFVTDSYFPNTNSATQAQYDLNSAQPFGRMYHEKNRQMSYMDQLDGSMSTPILTKLYDTVTELDTVSLYDYLDENDIPTSLALPTTERVPMICALRPSAELKLKPKVTEVPEEAGFDPKKNAPTTAEPDGTIKYTIKKYQLEFDGVGDIEAYCLFPFLRNHEADQGASFDVDFAFRIGFADTNPGLRVDGGSLFGIAGLKVNGTDQKFAFDAVSDNSADVKGGIICGHAKGTFSFSAAVTEEKQAFQKVQATLKMSDLESWFANAVLFAVPYAWEAKTDNTVDPPRRYWDPKGKATNKQDLFSVNADFAPLDKTGAIHSDFKTKDTLVSGTPSVTVRPYMTVTARVQSRRSEKCVDLVPAWNEDDKGYNALDTDVGIQSVCGDLRPVLSMGGSKDLIFSEDWFEKNKDSDIAESLSPSENGGVLVCPDPRWNFAPENFYVMDVSSLPDADTLITSFDFEGGGDGRIPPRDCDIFMATSDQGYMQSPSEFAFLPRTTNQRLPFSSQYGDAAKNPKGTAYATPDSTKAPYGKLAHGDLMWKTYHSFKGEWGKADDLYNLGITVGGSGFRINPFTSSKSVMMAALANTPVSWWAASTNYTDNAAGKSNLKDIDAVSFNEKYAFSGMNSNAKLAWDDLEKIAANMMAAMRETDGNWQAGYDDLDWDDEPNSFCGVDLKNSDPLYDVDRKMLYGFWRDSFANKQQLFLVFVRAEPTLMGGGAVGATPPALGVRAMALVWRDPNPTQADVGNNQPRPHRTRVLFYRQFD